jgi:hypothetical protein
VQKISRHRRDTIEYDTTKLQATPRKAYLRYIEKWKHDWNHCIKPERSYFEGDT